MNEKSSKRREWIKTAAIIFLSVLLVLTFFSQTILNHSLPEVATKYVQNGTITSKIRGSGNVESGDPYVIEIPAQYVGRKVSSISFKVGDKIKKGDVLMYLAEGEGSDLQAAKEALNASENNLKSAQEAYDTAILTAGITKSDINSANANVSANTYRKMITEKQEALKAANEKIDPLELAISQLDQAIADCTEQLRRESDNKSLADARLTTAQTALQQAQDNQTAAAAEYEAAENEKLTAEAEKANLEADIENSLVAEEEIESKRAQAQEKVTKATENYDAKKKALEEADDALKKAQENVATAIKQVNDQDSSPVINNIQGQMNDYVQKKYDYQKQLTIAKSEADKIQNDLNDLIGQISDVTNLQSLQDRINEAKKDVAEKKKKIEELNSENSGSEITSDISGTITSINVTSGKQIDMRDVMVVQPEGQGYFMSFSVTSEQAKTLSVGDKASLVNAWYYDDMDITLTSIKPDKQEPAKKKTLTFSVEGDVMAGQNLNVSVGQRSQNYDLIVPNSALRNDNNGDYILIVEAKSSPLGNRYIATRVDVTILAKDDTQAAISGGINGWEYVITTASAPIKAGDQVRLADN